MFHSRTTPNRGGFRPDSHVPFPGRMPGAVQPPGDHMLPQLHGRRNVLTGLATAVAMIAFAAPSFAATASINPTTTGYDADLTAGNPNHRTLNRTATINWTVAGTT